MTEESDSPYSVSGQRQGGRSPKPAVGALVGNLGRAGLALVGAEARAMRGDLSNTGRIAVRSGAWGLIAFALGVWGGAALTAGLVVLASKVLTLVQALLAVGTIFLVLAAGAIAMARRRMRQLESPVQSVKRRAGEHLAWWQTEVTTESEGPSGEVQ